MQGYEIDEYRPFTLYLGSGESILQEVRQNTRCIDPFVHVESDMLVCDQDVAKKNIDQTYDEQGRHKDYYESDCNQTRSDTIVPSYISAKIMFWIKKRGKNTENFLHQKLH